jgi:hypothetical protein
MAVGPYSFKRLVLGLQPSAQSRTMRLAVELANLLQLELLGVFLEDASLRDLARMPFAREFRLPEGGWQPIDLDRLSHDLEIASRNAERIFTEAARSLSTRWQFEAIRGPTPDTMASILRTDDIVMVTEPVGQVERATQQLSWLRDAAFRSAAAVMLVPARIVRAFGPVVAIAAATDDPSIEAAASIAIAAEEDLIILEASGGLALESRIRNLASETGLTIKHLVVGEIPLIASAAFSPDSRQLQERLLVMTRGVVEDAIALTIASERRVPVLVVEPRDATQALQEATTHKGSLEVDAASQAPADRV